MVEQHTQSSVLISHPTSSTSFLITDAPSNTKESLDSYLSLLNSHNITTLVRICNPDAYDATILKNGGIDVIEMYVEDGKTAGKEIVKQWRELVSSHSSSDSTTNSKRSSVQTPIREFKSSRTSQRMSKPPDARLSTTSTKDTRTIGIHCISGIGRAPMFVCMSLIDCGMDRLDAVNFIRTKRRGAINKIQLDWLMDAKNGFKSIKKGIFGSILKRFSGRD
jgi:protein tyrosine phosphatase type IVA